MNVQPSRFGGQWPDLRAWWAILPTLRERLDYQTALLAAFGLFVSLILAFGNLGTRGAIETRLEEDLKASLAEVLPAALYDNDLLASTVTLPSAGEGTGLNQTEVYVARRQGQVTAVAYRLIAPDGYAGPISLIIGVAADGRLLGVRTLAHNETPGLGDKIDAAKSDWVRSFEGKSLENAKFKVKKDGGDFDQFTGATITPRAYVKAVAGGLAFFAAHRTELLAPARAD